MGAGESAYAGFRASASAPSLRWSHNLGNDYLLPFVCILSYSVGNIFKHRTLKHVPPAASPGQHFSLPSSAFVHHHPQHRGTSTQWCQQQRTPSSSKRLDRGRTPKKSTSSKHPLKERVATSHAPTVGGSAQANSFPLTTNTRFPLMALHPHPPPGLTLVL